MLPTIEFQPDAVVMIDQRKLPAEEVYVTCKTAVEVARAIKTMVIRGAPAIGVAAAMGIALGMKRSKAQGTKQFAVEFNKLCDLMAATRPTAVNLFWAIARMKTAFGAAVQAGARSVIGSLWQVNDVGTAELMRQFYRRYGEGGPRAEAMRGAQLALIDAGGANADPNVWAAFALLGAWR